MTRIKDVVIDGKPEDLFAALQKQIDLLECKAAEVWARTELGDVCRVFPGLLRCTARQLRILKGSGTLPIEVTAGACRTTFEVNFAPAWPWLSCLSDETSIGAVRRRTITADGFSEVVGPPGAEPRTERHR